MFLTLILFTSSLFAQNLVTEFQEPPLNSFSNECAVYRESREYEVNLHRYVEFSALANVLYLDNGDILINRRIEDHLPYKNPPQPANVLYRVHPDGSMERYPFQTKSKNQQALYLGKMIASENNQFVISVGDRYLPATEKEYRVVIVTDLTSKVSTEVFTQSRDAVNLVENALISNDGEALLKMENGKMLSVKGPVQTPVEGVLPERFSRTLSYKPRLEGNSSDRDFSGVKVSPIAYREGNMTYISDTKRLSFLELGQEVGTLTLNGCNLIHAEEISAREARLTCDEGIMWLKLDTSKPVSELKRNILGFFPCK